MLAPAILEVPNRISLFIWSNENTFIFHSPFYFLLISILTISVLM